MSGASSRSIDHDHWPPDEPCRWCTADMIPRAKVRAMIVKAGADLAAMMDKAGALSRDWDMDQWRVEAEIIADRLLAELEPLTPIDVGLPYNTPLAEAEKEQEG